MSNQHDLGLRAIAICDGDGIPTWITEQVGLAETVCYVEWEPNCQHIIRCRIADGLLPDAPIWDDAKTFDGRPWRGCVDFIYGGIPCFAAGTLILTNAGYQPIEEVRRGELVLTHAGRWRPVTSTMQRDDAELVRVDVQGSPGTITTADHPYLARRRRTVWDNERRSNKREWDSYRWTPAGELGGDHFAAQVLPEEQYDDRTAEFWWVVGRYLADGWLLGRKTRGQGLARCNGRKVRQQGAATGHVIICCSKDESDELRDRIRAAGFHCFLEQDRTSDKWHIANGNLHRILSEFGKYARGKFLPGWVHELPQQSSEALLTGYLSGDGSFVERTGEWRATTVSKQLALGIALLAQRARGVVASVRHCGTKATTIIEGRTVNQRAFYVISIPRDNRSAFIEDGVGWKLVRRVVPCGTGTVYNISVDEDESYVADGCVVHNCQPYSVAGKQRGAEDERDLWPALKRIVGEVGPRLVLVENVSGLLGLRRGRWCEREFRRPERLRHLGPWITRWYQQPRQSAIGRISGELSAMGYDCEWATVSARDAGAPHRRDRVWLVAYSVGGSE